MKKFSKTSLMKSKLSAVFKVVLFLATGSIVSAQTAITGANLKISAATTGSTYSAPKAHEAGTGLTASTNYTYTYGNLSSFTDNSKTIVSFTAGGSGYTYKEGETPVIKVRRVENAGFTEYYKTGVTRVDNPTLRDLAYYEGLVDNSVPSIKIKSRYIPKIEDLFLTNDIAIGIDNLFANTKATNFNNIERIDVVMPTGRTILSPDAEGFAVFERGTYDGHDPAVVALITSVDVNNNPTSYATKVIRLTTANYFIAGQTGNKVYQPTSTESGNFIILRRDNATQNLEVSELINANQGIGGIMIKYSDFGIASGTKVYGYSVLANDFPVSGTGVNVIDYTNPIYFPTNSDDASGIAGNDMSTITGVVKIITISGNVYHDPNGLKDNVVNGTAINNPSGTQLYVNLVNSANLVVGVATVQSDGSFTFNQLEFGVLTAQLSMNQGTVGQAAPAKVLPSTWVNTGENFGLQNGSGTGNDSPMVGDGSINVLVGDENITAIKFGIEKIPVADDKTTAGRNVPGDPVRLPVPTLTGRDPEDLEYTGVSLTNTIIIKSLGVNGVIFYNNSPVTLGQIIPNYNPSKLEVDPNNTNSTAPFNVTFTYSFIDAAGKESVPATVTMPFLDPLPVKLISFSATALSNNSVQLDWETSYEMNNDYFEIQRSKDLITVETVGKAKDVVGNSSKGKKYLFVDTNPIQGYSYYRLSQTDLDGTKTLNRWRSVSTRQDGYGIFPNPANSQKFNVKLDEPSSAKITLFNTKGQSVQFIKTVIDSGNLSIQMQENQPAGKYILKVEERGTINTYTVVIF